MKTLDYLNLTNHFGKNVTIDWAEDTTNNSVPLPELGEGGVLVSAPDGRKESTGELSFPELRHIIKSPATKYQLVMGDGNPGQSWKCIYDNMNNTSQSIQLPQDFPIETYKDMIMFVKYKHPDNDYYSGTLGFIFSWHDAQDYFEDGHSWDADCLIPPQSEVIVSAKDNGSVTVYDITYTLVLQNRALALYRDESAKTLTLSPLSEYKGGDAVPLRITQVFILKDLPVTP